MERLKADDIAQARLTTPEQKFRQALDMMAWGIEIKRANLRRRHAEEREAEIGARLQRWLRRVDD